MHWNALAVAIAVAHFLDGGRLNELPGLAFVPRPARIDFAVIAFPVESLKT
jgi:hypothetical protein